MCTIHNNVALMDSCRSRKYITVLVQKGAMKWRQMVQDILRVKLRDILKLSPCLYWSLSHNLDMYALEHVPFFSALFCPGFKTKMRGLFAGTVDPISLMVNANEHWWGTKWHSYIKPLAIHRGQPGFYGAPGHWALWALMYLQTCVSRFISSNHSQGPQLIMWGLVNYTHSLGWPCLETWLKTGFFFFLLCCFHQIC